MICGFVDINTLWLSLFCKFTAISQEASLSLCGRQARASPCNKSSSLCKWVQRPSWVSAGRVCRWVTPRTGAGELRPWVPRAARRSRTRPRSSDPQPRPAAGGWRGSVSEAWGAGLGAPRGSDRESQGARRLQGRSAAAQMGGRPERGGRPGPGETRGAARRRGGGRERAGLPVGHPCRHAQHLRRALALLRSPRVQLRPHRC